MNEIHCRVHKGPQIQKDVSTRVADGRVVCPLQLFRDIHPGRAGGDVAESLDGGGGSGLCVSP